MATFTDCAAAACPMPLQLIRVAEERARQSQLTADHYVRAGASLAALSAEDMDVIIQLAIHIRLLQDAQEAARERAIAAEQLKELERVLAEMN